MTGRVGLLGAMLAVLVGAAPAAAAPLKPCRDDKSARCGAIAVPVHRSDPQGPKLKVRFRVFPHSDRSRPALEPIVAAEGGPGYSTIGSASGYEFMLRPLLARRDLIVMDNRGTGSSGAAATCMRSAAVAASSGHGPTPTGRARPPMTWPPSSTAWRTRW